MRKVDRICSGLRAKGYNVVWAEETDDRYAVGIDFVDNREVPWVRAFHLDQAADVPAFVREIEDWKKKVRLDLHLNMPSETVQAVVAHYGLEKTYQALRAKHG